MAEPAVRIEGLIQLRRSLRGVGAEAPKELSRGLKGVAQDLAPEIERKVPRRSGKARDSIRPRAAGAGAAIAVGGSRAPYFPWLDFGGSTKVPGRGDRVQRAFIKRGRYIYPTIAEQEDDINQKLDGLMRALTERYGFDTRGNAAGR